MRSANATSVLCRPPWLNKGIFTILKRISLCRHFRQLELGVLERGQRFAELLPDLGMLDGLETRVHVSCEQSSVFV